MAHALAEQLQANAHGLFARQRLLVHDHASSRLDGELQAERLLTLLRVVGCYLLTTVRDGMSAFPR